MQIAYQFGFVLIRQQRPFFSIHFTQIHQQPIQMQWLFLKGASHSDRPPKYIVISWCK